MAKEYLIDTSIVIKYLNQTLPKTGVDFVDGFINSDCTISFISEIELQGWNPVNPYDSITYQHFVKQSHIIGITPDIVSHTIRIRKEYKLKLGDAVIAATAVSYNLSLVADNDNDFGKVTELKLLNPRKM